jgi:predicted acyl esterase
VDANISLTVVNQKRKHMRFDRAITEEIIEKRESRIRLKLEEDKNVFSPGETIRGKITIESSKKLPKIRKIQTILGAIEFAQAKRKKKRTEILPKYEQTIKWNGGNNSYIVPFEVHIPKEIRRSYLGKLSKYYCLLEAKVDIPWSDDLYDRAIIQIV